MSATVIWERGIWLAKAPYHFAPNKLRAKYDAPEIETPFAAKGGIGMLARAISEESTRQELLSAARKWHEVSGKHSVRSDTLWQMKDRLLQWLQRRKLIALGFRMPRNTDSAAEQIPADLFQQRHVNWEVSTISGAGLEFVSVRVLRPHWIKGANAQLPQLPKLEMAAPKKRPPGRPSSKDAITAAILSLIADRKLPNANTRKENITLVRARVHKLFPGLFPADKGLAEETIGKYLVIVLPRP